MTKKDHFEIERIKAQPEFWKPELAYYWRGIVFGAVAFLILLMILVILILAK